MAHVNQSMKKKGKFATDSGQAKPAFKDRGKPAGNGGKFSQANQRPGGVNKQKRKWVPEHKVFEGSVGEGQGFAFRRKQKVQHEYNKLLRKERKKHAPVKTFYRDEFPDHLSHLYKAEAVKLYDEARTSRIKRTQCRLGVVVEEVLEDAPAEQAQSTDAVAGSGPVSTEQAGPATQQTLAQPGATPDQTDPATPQPEHSPAYGTYSLPMSNRQKKRLLKKTSYQRTKEEFESVKEKRAKKKEEFLKNKQQREEAIQKYKQKKKETFKVLNTKTKKGQPNLNVQMEYLLQKIQGTGK